MENNSNCCSVIVTYKRKELLCRNIGKNLFQSAAPDIVIFDNSPDDETEKCLKERGFIDNPRVKYFRNEKNEFGSGGFYRGLEYVFSNGYKYAWLMDDDGYPMKEDTLSKLLDAANRIDSKEIMLNSAVLRNENTFTFNMDGIGSLGQLRLQTKGSNGMHLNYICPFNGTLISEETYKKIGNIRKEFLIHGDESEYFNRALKNGVFVATVADSLFHHPVHNHEKAYVWNGNIYYFRYTPPWMEFYEIRNRLRIRMEYETGESHKQYIRKAMIKIACAPENKFKYAFYIIRGIRAAKRNNFRPLKIHGYLDYK